VIVIAARAPSSHPAYLSSTFMPRGQPAPRRVLHTAAETPLSLSDFRQVAMPTPRARSLLIEAFAPTR